MGRFLSAVRERAALCAHVLLFMLAAVPVAIGGGVIAQGFISCKATQLSPSAQDTIAQLEKKEAETEAELEAAHASGDPVRIAKAEAADGEVKGQLAQVEADGAAEQVHSVFQLFGLSWLVPGGPKTENAIATLFAFAFPRPRQHLVRIIKGLNPFNRELTPLDALRSLGSMVGLLHSSPTTAAVFDPAAPAKPVDVTTSTEVTATAHATKVATKKKSKTA